MQMTHKTTCPIHFWIKKKKRWKKAERNHVDRRGSGVADDTRADEIREVLSNPMLTDGIRSTGLVISVVKSESKLVSFLLVHVGNVGL